MALNQEVTFTLRGMDGESHLVARTDIGNTSTLEMTYEFPLLSSAPLVSSNTVHFKGKAKAFINARYIKHDKLIYVDVKFPTVPNIITYTIAVETIVYKYNYIECNLVLQSLYNELSNNKETQYDIDLNSLQEYPIELPRTKGFNRLLFIGSTAEGPLALVDNTVTLDMPTGWPKGTDQSAVPIIIKSGPQHFPIVLYRAEVSTKNIFMVDKATTPGFVFGRDFNRNDLTIVGSTPGATEAVLNIPNQFTSTEETDSLFFLAYVKRNGIDNMHLTIQANNSITMYIDSTLRRTFEIDDGAKVTTTTHVRWYLRSFYYYPKTNVSSSQYKVNEVLGHTVINDTHVFDDWPWESVRRNQVTMRIPNIDMIIEPIAGDDPDDLFYEVFVIMFEIEARYFPTTNSIVGAMKTPQIQLSYNTFNIPEQSPLLINVEYAGRFSTTKTSGYKLSDLLQSGINRMINVEKLSYEDVQTYIEPFKAMSTSYDILVVPMESIKNKNKRLMYFKLKDFTEVMYGLGYQLFSGPNNISFVDRAAADFITIEANDNSDYTIAHSKVLTNTVEIGYNLDETNTSTIDPHRRATYKTPIQYKAEALSLILPYRADALGLLKALESVKEDTSNDYDTWWDLIGTNSTTDTVEATDVGMFMVVCEPKYESPGVYKAMTKGAPAELEDYKIFNWPLSTTGLLFKLSPYLKYSGTQLELISSYGMREGTVKVPNDTYGILTSPVADLDYYYGALTSGIKEEYGGRELSTSIKMSYKDFVSIIEASASNKNVHLSLPNVKVKGLLLSAKVNLASKAQVDVTMLIGSHEDTFNTPKLPSNFSFPSSKTLRKRFASASSEYIIFVSSPNPIPGIAGIPFTVYRGNVAVNVPITVGLYKQGLGPNTYRYLKVSVNTQSPQITVGEYQIVFNINGTQINHTLIITE